MLTEEQILKLKPGDKLILDYPVSIGINDEIRYPKGAVVIFNKFFRLMSTYYINFDGYINILSARASREFSLLDIKKKRKVG